jgi:recombination protein RecA
MAMVNAQRAGGLAVFADHENSFDMKLAKGFGLSDDADNFVYLKPDTFEASVDTVQEIVLAARALTIDKGSIVPSGEDPVFGRDLPMIVVFDSLASMVPQSVLTDSKGKAKATADRTMNDTTALARATSANFPRLAMLAERGNATIVFLNQVRTKLGVMYGDPTTTPGGGAPEYFSSIRLRLGRSMITEGKEKLGQKIGAETIKNKISAPFQKAEWDFLFQPDGSGRFDVTGGMIAELVSLGKIESSGPWMTWDGRKWNSRKHLVTHIEANDQVGDLIKLFPGAA